jgi:alkanesulfonate monooxygenase SsuD/methylene tetrahydromethanopterin reductase-like flavin-dependent oxidoreductase (luciferase family)
VHPVREHIPMYLAAVGPKNLELSGELFDGWLAIFYSPDFAKEQLGQIEAGRAKVGKTLEGFDVVPTVPIVVGDDPRACAEPGAGLRGAVRRRDGQPGQELLQPARRRAWASTRPRRRSRTCTWAASTPRPPRRCPFEFLDATALLGSKERIAEKMQALAASGVTTLTLSPFAGSIEEKKATLRTAVEALELAGVGS